MGDVSNNCILVQTTVKRHTDAMAMGETLINANLVACIHISPPITSLYLWDEALQTDEEYVLIGKTAKHLIQAVEDTIKQIHSYELPEIIFTQPYSISTEYNKWIHTVCR